MQQATILTRPSRRCPTGRNFKYGEPTVKREFRIPESLNDQLSSEARRRDSNISDVLVAALRKEVGDVRDANQELVESFQAAVTAMLANRGLAPKGVDHHAELLAHEPGLTYLRPTVTSEAADFQRLVSVRLLAKAPCGPWMEALEQAEEFSLSPEMAQLIGLKEGDFLVRAVGESMEEAGIPDGSLILMRPLKGGYPERGEVTLVQVETRGGDFVGTIKHWFQTPTRAVDLRDGRGMPYHLPADTLHAIPVAVKRGLLSRG